MYIKIANGKPQNQLTYAIEQKTRKVIAFCVGSKSIEKIKIEDVNFNGLYVYNVSELITDGLIKKKYLDDIFFLVKEELKSGFAFLYIQFLSHSLYDSSNPIQLLFISTPAISTTILK